MNLKLDVKSQKERRRGRWRNLRLRGGKEEQEGVRLGRYSFLLSSFYPGTKLLFWHRLFEFGVPAEYVMMRRSPLHRLFHSPVSSEELFRLVLVRVHSCC